MMLRWTASWSVASVPMTQPRICYARLTNMTKCSIEGLFHGGLPLFGIDVQSMTAVELMVAAQQWSAVTRAMPAAKPSVKPVAATADGPPIRKPALQAATGAP
ncbi:hypothetical protein HaLaN_11719, partial [Haematococcus lacustris]